MSLKFKKNRTWEWDWFGWVCPVVGSGFSALCADWFVMARRSEFGMYGEVAHCILLSWAECMQRLWEIWQENRWRMMAWISTDLEGGLFVPKGSQPYPFLWPTYSHSLPSPRGIWRHAWSGNHFFSSLASLYSMPQARCSGNNQLLAAPTDLCMSLPLFILISPSEMLSAKVEVAVLHPNPMHCVYCDHSLWNTWCTCFSPL